AGAIAAGAALSRNRRTAAVLVGGASLAGSAAIVAHRPAAAGAAPLPAPPLAVLLDRDGTLIHDVPYNADPSLVLPMPGVRRALDRLRARGVKVGVVSNQSGVGRGLLTSDQVAAVTRRVVELLGPFDDVRWCPHVAADACDCRKPAPGLLLAAAAQLGVDPLRCAVIGDIGADVSAARAAGMRGILVPTAETRPEEIAAAAEQAANFAEAVDQLLREPSLGPAPVLSPAGPRSTHPGLEAA
ncbi:MAG: HAD-superfamily hydrolase subfamily, partial [Conexibacter sp.]|nr:HAD-superfamily hydrolase subfamily [Conexibacter sp.]